MCLQEEVQPLSFFAKAALAAGPKRLHRAGLDDEVEVTLLVRSKPGCPRLPDGMQAPGSSVLHRQYLSRAAFEQAHGASRTDLALIQQFAWKHGITVVESSAIRRAVVLRGSVEQISRLFSADRVSGWGARRGERSCLQRMQAPPELAELVENVHRLERDPLTLLPAAEDKKGRVPESFSLRGEYLA